MQAGRKRTVISAAIALVVLIADAPMAVAQLVQSDVESATPTPQTSQLVTSSTEVRRAVIGLIALAVVVALLGIWYWRKTGKQAAARHAHKYGGKHHGGADATNQQPRTPPAMAAHAAVPGSGAAPRPQVSARTAPSAARPLAGPGQSTLAPSLMADPGLAGVNGFGAGYGAPPPSPVSARVMGPAPSVAGDLESVGLARARSQSPYPDGAGPAPHQMAEGRWATLRRDLFG